VAALRPPAESSLIPGYFRARNLPDGHAPCGRLTRAVRFTITAGKIVAVEVVAKPEHLKNLEVAVFD
jgi:hypothetical protein